MPRDIFGGWGKAPSNDDIEREAQKELDRLTRAPGPGGPGGVGGMGGAGPPSFGPKSPLEAMAEGLAQRKKKRRKGVQASEDRSEWKQGFAGPAAISGAVGSSLGFGGGVAPGTMRMAPPPDAKPLHRQDREQGVDEDDPDDDLWVSEVALRDNAERTGKSLEDMVIRADPNEAEAMRAAAMQRFMQRQPQAEAPGEYAPPARLNLRRRARGSEAGGPAPGPEVAVVEPDDEDPEETAAREASGPQGDAGAGAAQPPTADGRPQLGLMVDERARVAERRAEVAEERAQLAEARAEAAELELSAAAGLVAEYERRVDELGQALYELQRKEAERDAAEEQARQAAAEAERQRAADDADRSRRRARKPPAKAGAPAKKAPATRKRVPPKSGAGAEAKASASRKAPSATKAPPSKAPPSRKASGPAKAPAARSARTKKAPPAPAAEEGAAPIGGVLGRRLAQKRR